MKTKLTLLSLITVGVLSIALADQHTDKGHVAVKHSLTLEGAKQVGEAAAKYAKENGAGPSIAIVDDGGNLLYFTRPETSFAAGANVSIGKARTSAIFKKRTSFFEDTINQGRFTMTALPDFTPLQGGVPIMHDGQVIGRLASAAQRARSRTKKLRRPVRRCSRRKSRPNSVTVLSLLIGPGFVNAGGGCCGTPAPVP